MRNATHRDIQLTPSSLCCLLLSLIHYKIQHTNIIKISTAAHKLPKDIYIYKFSKFGRILPQSDQTATSLYKLFLENPELPDLCVCVCDTFFGTFCSLKPFRVSQKKMNIWGSFCCRTNQKLLT